MGCNAPESKCRQKPRSQQPTARSCPSGPVSRLPASPSTAAADEGLPVQLGGDTAAGPGETDMQHPILTALDGGANRVDGQLVLEGIGVILGHLLPDVPADDPYRAALVALACAAGCQPTTQRPRLEAL